MTSQKPLTEAPSGERPGITLTRDQLEAWATRALSDEQVEQIEEAIPNTSIPDAIVAISDSLHFREGENDD